MCGSDGIDGADGADGVYVDDVRLRVRMAEEGGEKKSKYDPASSASSVTYLPTYLPG